MSDSIPVSKKTLTYADTLLTVGWASLLEECLGGTVRIKDCGDHFDVIAGCSFSSKDFENQRISPGYKYVLNKSDKDNEQPVGDVFDYEREREKAKIYRQYQKDMQNAKNRGQVNKARQETGESEINRPNPELQVLTILSSMRKGFRGDKDVHQLIEENSDCMGSIVAKRIAYYRNTDNQLAAEENIFAGKVSNSQFFNPITGKGVIRPKPDGTTLASYPKKAVDWFEEWLKFRGMYNALLAYRSGDDLKLYVIEPQDVPSYVLKRLRHDLLKENLWGGIKLDIQAALNLAKVLIIHSKEFDPTEGMMFMQGTPKDVIGGLHLAYFKSLGTAAALMNCSFLGLPGWFEIHNHETAVAFLEIIEEHIGDRSQRKMGCLGSLRENNSGDVPILTQYRSFLSSGNLMTFLEFLAMFATHIIQQRERKQPVKQFSTTNLGRLFVMGYDLQKIVDNEGFLNIATAIRKATVNAQYRKVAGTQVWDIHYGLAQEWKRQVKYPDRFVIALSKFAQQYNAENARHAEQGKERRKNISTQDLSQVVKLIEDKGSELVGMLLLAYGYAKEPKEPKEDTIQE